MSLFFYDSEKSKDAIKVIAAVVFDLNGSLFFAVVELDSSGEAVGE